jgi:hypothetical protein
MPESEGEGFVYEYYAFVVAFCFFEIGANLWRLQDDGGA